MIVFFLIGCSLFGACGGNATTAPATPTPTIARSTATASSGPFQATARTFDGAFTIALEITPARSGPNQFEAHVTDNHTHKPAVQKIILTLYTTMQDMPMGTDSLALRAEGGGLFSATSTILSMGGHWAIGITIQTNDHVIHKAGVSFFLPQ